MPKSAPSEPKTHKYAHVAQALAESRPTVDSGQLLCDLMEVWGGPRQLAMDIHAEFRKAPAGGMTRQRILEMFQRLIVTNTTNDIGKVSNPSDATDEELESELLGFVRKLNDADPRSAAPGPESEG